MKEATGFRYNDQALTDIVNKDLFVHMHGDDLRHFAMRGAWLTWAGNRWIDDTTGETARRAETVAEAWRAASNAVQVPTAVKGDDTSEAAHTAAIKKRDRLWNWAKVSSSRERLVALVDLAKNAKGIAVTADELDADPWLLNCRNGVLDLRDGTMRPPTKELLQTKLAAVEYHPGAKSPLWEGFIADLTGGDAELAGYLQRALGYALYGAWAEKHFWFCYGPRDGGKSTLLNILAGILGDYHVAADASTWMVGKSGNRGDVTRLRGARLVTTSEVRAGSRFDEEIVKKVTGGDTLTYAAKYENDISFKPTFALWLAANDRPSISSSDDAMWRRVVCIPCVHSVPKARQNPRLAELLAGPEHAPAVLAWLVEGCQAWQRDGLGTCAAIDAENDAYRLEMNPLLGFAEECLILEPDACMPVTELRDAYAEWCANRRERFPLSAKSFPRAVRGLGITGGDDESRIAIKGKQVRMWRGVRSNWNAR